MLPDENQSLLLRLPAQERAALVAACDRVTVKRGERLAAGGQAVVHLYLPLDAAISLLAPGNSRHLEVALLGNEGVVGGEIATGVGESPWTAVCSVAGTALRLDASQFREALARSVRLGEVMARFHWVLTADLAQAVVCARFHSLEQRLARWLLMADQRSGPGVLPVTHAQLAALLGVRRAGVTQGLSQLQRQHCLELQRGGVHVLDTAALGAAACVCHGSAEARYERAFGVGAVWRTPDPTSIFHNPAIFIR